jgi:hypothetical protein
VDRIPRPGEEAEEDHGSSSKGKVYLVGMGLGSPENITPKALEALRYSQIVVGHEHGRPGHLRYSEHLLTVPEGGRPRARCGGRPWDNCCWGHRGPLGVPPRPRLRVDQLGRHSDAVVGDRETTENRDFGRLRVGVLHPHQQGRGLAASQS